MFKSLINATTTNINSLILDIFIILGVVIAGALIIYFLWEIISAIMHKSGKSEDSIKKPNLGKKKQEQEVAGIVDFDLDEQKIVEVEDVAEKTEEAKLFEDDQLVEINEDKVNEEKVDMEEKMAEEEAENAARRAALEAKRQELIRRMQASMEEEPEEIEESEEVEEETVEEQEVVENNEVAEVEVDSLKEEREELAAQKAKYETMVKELEAAKIALAAQVEAEPVATITNGVLSLEELKAKLAEAEEKLKATEKEFKQCKKEYKPLHRVWVTHEKDERKLRRKEALVAKQKVLLYGVNNYADIDEEKAKKLAEDLDLLDGLKLSVQHCEEVMKKNEERYPLLERMYKVLSSRNEELKKDIAYYKAEIAKLEGTEESAE